MQQQVTVTVAEVSGIAFARAIKVAKIAEVEASCLLEYFPPESGLALGAAAPGTSPFHINRRKQ